MEYRNKGSKLSGETHFFWNNYPCYFELGPVFISASGFESNFCSSFGSNFGSSLTSDFGSNFGSNLASDFGSNLGSSLESDFDSNPGFGFAFDKFSVEFALGTWSWVPNDSTVLVLGFTSRLTEVRVRLEDKQASKISLWWEFRGIIRLSLRSIKKTSLCGWLRTTRTIPEIISVPEANPTRGLASAPELPWGCGSCACREFAKQTSTKNKKMKSFKSSLLESPSSYQRWYLLDSIMPFVDSQTQVKRELGNENSASPIPDRAHWSRSLCAKLSWRPDLPRPQSFCDLRQDSCSDERTVSSPFDFHFSVLAENEKYPHLTKIY